MQSSAWTTHSSVMILVTAYCIKNTPLSHCERHDSNHTMVTYEVIIKVQTAIFYPEIDYATYCEPLNG